MPVSPPYSIIDTIARLRAEGGAAWGQAAQSVGQSIGQGAASAGASVGQAMHERAHDAMLQLDSKYDVGKMDPNLNTRPTPANPAAPTPQANPNGLPGPEGGKLSLQGNSPSPGASVIGGPVATPAQMGNSSPTYKLQPGHPDYQDTVGDFMQRNGIKLAPNSPHFQQPITPKITGREESQARTTQEEMRLASEEKRGENKAASAASLEAGKLQGRKELLKEQNDEKDKLKKQDALDKKAQEDQKAHDKQLETSARAMSSSDLAKAKSGYKKSENKAKWRTDHPIWAKGLDMAGMGDASESVVSVPVGQHDDDAAIDAALKASGGQ